MRPILQLRDSFILQCTSNNQKIPGYRFAVNIHKVKSKISEFRGIEYLPIKALFLDLLTTLKMSLKLL